MNMVAEKMSRPNSGQVTERVCERISGWFKWGQTTRQFWEVFFTGQRVIFALVGETYTSFLLRGDTADERRRSLADMVPEEILAADPHNFAIPLDQVAAVALRRGSLVRMPCLTIRAAGGRKEVLFVDDRRYDIARHLGLRDLLPGRAHIAANGR